MKKPYVSVVVPVLNESENLPRLFASLSNVSYPRNRLEVIIVDGGSTDATIRIARQHGARILHNPGKLRGAGCQVGLTAARGDVVAFTDADCRLPRNWLKDLIGLLREPSVAAVGGPNVTPTDDTRFAKAAGAVIGILTKPGARYGHMGVRVTPIFHNPGCNVVYRKRALEHVGGFRTELVTCEDEELDFRLRQSGYTLLFTPEVVVDHFRRPTLRKIGVQAFRYAAGRAQAGLMHPGMLRWFHIVPTVILLAVVTGVSLAVVGWTHSLLLVLSGLGLLVTLVTVSFAVSVRHPWQPPQAYAAIFSLWAAGWAVGFVYGIGYALYGLLAKTFQPVVHRVIRW